MRFQLDRLRVVFEHVGQILFVFGLLLLIPFILSLAILGADGQDVRAGTFAIPILVSLVLGLAARWQARRWGGPRRLGTPEAMLICVFGWLVISAVGAIPFSYELGVSYLDAYFEAMSGFTTTGITMLQGLGGMPRSLLFWRSMTQWIGGLGILTFFLVVVFQGGLSHRLFGAESHKIRGPRPAPGMWNTLKILWLVYVLFTAVVIGGLILCGVTVYDAVSHSFTCLSTGGYSPYDASIAHYAEAGYRNHAAIEYVIIFGMWAGGTNFLIHYRVVTGKLKALWDNDEMRAWWLILGGSLALVLGAHLFSAGAASESLAAGFRHSLFQVVSIATTTGFATRDIADPSYFPPLTRQVFLVLMLIGGCAGSTGGGLKVLRVALLWKILARQVRRAVRPPSSIDTLLIDGKPVPPEEASRTAALFFGWVALVFAGALTTAALSRHGAVESASGMFSALGNIGPCYISVADMGMLHPLIKVVYILGMLAGRLEIIPVLMLLNRRTWR